MDDVLLETFLLFSTAFFFLKKGERRSRICTLRGGVAGCLRVCLGDVESSNKEGGDVAVGREEVKARLRGERLGSSLKTTRGW
jgi:hypothetical protein